jgi:NADH-quinone oxidoreductase subunit J
VLLDTIIFYAAAIIAVFGAVMMILQRNPVASVLYLIVSLVAQAILYIQLSAVFVGALLIIVYAGAILVLFLFVIMLLNLRGERFEEPRPKMSLSAKYILSFVFFIELSIIIRETIQTNKLATPDSSAITGFGDVEPVAELLFTKYLYPFELTSILLLVAIVGAVIMAKREKSDDTGEVS